MSMNFDRLDLLNNLVRLRVSDRIHGFGIFFGLLFSVYSPCMPTVA